jgi:hypothetical protein
MENQQQTWEDWATEIFVGDNYYYYKDKWKNQKPDRSFTSWNWVAFFFPYYWMAFRKMYIYAFLVIIGSLISYIIPFGGIILHVIAGVYANYWYYNKCSIAVKTASQYTNEDAIAYLKKQGGTSGLSLVLSIVIIVLIVSIGFGGLYAFYKYSDSTDATSIESTLSPNESALSPAETTTAAEKITYDITTKGGEITYTVPEGYETLEYENPDLFLNATAHGVSIISYVYRQEDFDDSVNEAYFIEETAKIYSEDYALEPVTDTALPVLDSEALQALYSNADEGIISYYYITCEKIDNYFVLTLAITSPSNWLKYQNEIVEISSSATLNIPNEIVMVPLKPLRGATAILRL